MYPSSSDGSDVIGHRGSVHSRAWSFPLSYAVPHQMRQHHGINLEMIATSCWPIRVVRRSHMTSQTQGWTSETAGRPRNGQATYLPH